MNRHPVVEDTIRFDTEPLRECVKFFKDRVANGERGMLIYGPPKQGVTTACRHICEGLQEARRSVVLLVQALPSDYQPLKVQADELWRQLLPADAITGYVRRPRDALARYIEVEADLLQTKYVVLAIDHAENLSLRQWEDLKILVETLRKRLRLSCFCLIAGQSELLALPTRMRRILRHALLAEFFVGVHRFRGVRLNELCGVLGHYDSLRYPVPYGPTYTEHFCPVLWTRGLRIVQVCDAMRDRFAKILKAAGSGAEEIAMEYVAAAARRFLLAAEGLSQDGSLKLDELAAMCVDQSGLREALTMLGNPEVDAIRQHHSRRRDW